MRKSNIVLVSMFIIAVAVMTMLQASVYKKAKKNEIEDGTYYRNKREKENYATNLLNPFTNIKIENCDDVGIVYGPEYKVLVNNLIANRILVKSDGSTLSIQDTRNKSYEYEFAHSDVYEKPIIIYCPSITTIQAKRASVLIDSFPSTGIDSVNIKAETSSISLGPNSFYREQEFTSKKVSYGSLHVTLLTAKFSMANTYSTKKIHLSASNSSNVQIRSQELGDTPELEISDECSVEIPGKLLKKIKQ
jgi:hypothetical protein